MIEIQLVSSVNEMESHRRAWSDLLKNALDQNLYFSPQFLIPALRHFGIPGKSYILFLYLDFEETRRLIAMIPIEEKPRSLVLPCRSASSFVYPHCFLCFPIIHKDHVSESITALKDWLDSQKVVNILEIPNIYNGSETWLAINNVAKQHGWRYSVTEQCARPMLQRRDSYDNFLQGVSKKRRKKLRQINRRLSERGTLTVNIYKDIADIPDLANRFMALEKLGWKGENKSALASSANGRAFFNEVVAATPADAELFFTELTLDQAPVAMSANFIINSDFFAFKVAFDPAYAKFSPGIYLEYEAIRLMYVYSNFQRADSGAEQDSFIGSIWPERLELMTIYLARKGLFARLWLHYMCTGKAIKAKIREIKTRSQAFISR